MSMDLVLFPPSQVPLHHRRDRPYACQKPKATLFEPRCRDCMDLAVQLLEVNPRAGDRLVDPPLGEFQSVGDFDGPATVTEIITAAWRIRAWAVLGPEGGA